jgi:hypothetical protein
MTNRTQNIGFLVPLGQSARETEKQHFISSVLYLPGSVAWYHVHERLSELFPGKAIVETGDRDFDLMTYIRDGQCTVTSRAIPHAEWPVFWDNGANEVRRFADNAWLDIAWQSEILEVLALRHGDDRRNFILADRRDVAMRFFRDVCRWGTEVTHEVMVFERGSWSKNEDLFKAIQSATFDNLVLPPGFKEEIIADATRFFAARATYDEYGIPWKRGLLFAGPPGNGKTHAVKALVNHLGKPCLYVKSFRQHGNPDEYAMHSVFAQARLSAPCVLVLEDLDALITANNRSFFLNEMDGFAANAGILTVATSNHPEQLDPAIAQRPSRFDRTYQFTLPALPERLAFVARWNATIKPEMRLSRTAAELMAEETEGFSFAYLKELLISAMVRWIDAGEAMDEVMLAQIVVLREQMGTGRDRDKTDKGGKRGR